jgi:lipoprotein-anchoring transpeptidase ErfK/SrfK
MRARRTRYKLVASVLVALLLALPVVPAVAADGDPVVKTGVTIGGTSLQGMTAEEASVTIGLAVPASALATLSVEADGHVFPLVPGSVLALDLDGLVADALAAPEGLVLMPRYSVDATAVSAFVDGVAAVVNRKAVSAKRVISHRRLRISASSTGSTVGRASSIATLTVALASRLPGAEVATVTLPVTHPAPRTTLANIGKTIIVSLREFKVILYKGAKVEKSYRCAIGMNAYPTPRGVFKVIAKSAAPTWRNPYSSWSQSMPAFIRPGYYNPLGLRALYLSASGIRIHGTSKTYSIGHKASHGCIRLTNHSVVDIYPRVKVGTPVYIVR